MSFEWKPAAAGRPNDPLPWESHVLLTGPIKDLKSSDKNQKDIVCFQLACDVLPFAFPSRFRSIHGMEAVILRPSGRPFFPYGL